MARFLLALLLVAAFVGRGMAMDDPAAGDMAATGTAAAGKAAEGKATGDEKAKVTLGKC